MFGITQTHVLHVIFSRLRQTQVVRIFEANDATQTKDECNLRWLEST